MVIIYAQAFFNISTVLKCLSPPWSHFELQLYLPLWYVFYSPSPFLVKILRCGTRATIPNLQMKRSREFLGSKSTQWRSWETVRHRCGQWERLAQRQPERRQMFTDSKEKKDTDSGGCKDVETWERSKVRNRRAFLPLQTGLSRKTYS